MHSFPTFLFVIGSLVLFASALPLVINTDAREEFPYDDSSITKEASNSIRIVSTPLSFDSIVEFDDTEDAILADWKAGTVDQHNTYRAQYGAPPLSWSDALYPGTLQWARQCKFEHSQSNGVYGENLAAGTGQLYGFPTGLKDWMNEASRYDYNRPGFSPGTGHFTQVVWKGSKQVACAIADCPGGTIFSLPSKYVVCRYSSPGNFLGRYPQNVGTLEDLAEISL